MRNTVATEGHLWAGGGGGGGGGRHYAVLPLAVF